LFLEIPLLRGLASLLSRVNDRSSTSSLARACLTFDIKKSKFIDHTVIKSMKKTAVKRPWRANRCINILLIAFMVAGGRVRRIYPMRRTIIEKRLLQTDEHTSSPR
jgi:hypothetical protein